MPLFGLNRWTNHDNDQINTWGCAHYVWKPKCQGKQKSAIWILGLFHSLTENFSYQCLYRDEVSCLKNTSIEFLNQRLYTAEPCESVHKVTSHHMNMNSGAPDVAVHLCFYLRFHGVILSCCVFLCVENGNAFVAAECSSGTDWGCDGKSLLALPFMVSRFRHALLCLLQLFITYDTSNMISWGEYNSSQPPAIYTALHLTQTKVKIDCMDAPVPIWLTAGSVFRYALIVYTTQWWGGSLHGQKRKAQCLTCFSHIWSSAGQKKWIVEDENKKS